MIKIAFFTLGCKVNQYDTETFKKIFLDHNYEIVNPTEIADIYLVNTCAVTNLSTVKLRKII